MMKTGVCVFTFVCIISAYSCYACQFCGGTGLCQGGYGDYGGSMFGYGGGFGGLSGLGGLGGGLGGLGGGLGGLGGGLGGLGSLEEELGGGCGGGCCGGNGGTDLNIGLNHRKCGPLQFGLSLKVGRKDCDCCNRKSCACGRCCHLKEKIESNKEALKDYLATKAISRVNLWDRLLENRLRYKLGKLGCI